MYIELVRLETRFICDLFLWLVAFNDLPIQLINESIEISYFYQQVTNEFQNFASDRLMNFALFSRKFPWLLFFFFHVWMANFQSVLGEKMVLGQSKMVSFGEKNSSIAREKKNDFLQSVSRKKLQNSPSVSWNIRKSINRMQNKISKFMCQMLKKMWMSSINCSEK